MNWGQGHELGGTGVRHQILTSHNHLVSDVQRCSTKLSESFKQLHRRIIIQTITAELASVQSLEIRLKRYTDFGKKNYLLAIQRHGRPDLDQDIVIYFCVLVTIAIKILSFRSDMNNARRAGSHVFENLFRHGNSGRLPLYRNHRLKMTEAQKFLDLGNDRFLFSMSDEDAIALPISWHSGQQNLLLVL